MPADLGDLRVWFPLDFGVTCCMIDVTHRWSVRTWERTSAVFAAKCGDNRCACGDCRNLRTALA